MRAALRLTWLDPYLLLLLVLGLLAVTPLAAPGYFFDAHDGRHTVFYLQQFDASLRSGALWPTWAMHHIQGYGYPTFLIQAPIGFYLGALFVGLGAGYTLAVKLTWVTGFLLSGWGMYQLVIHWLRRADNGQITPPFAGHEAVGAFDPIRLAAVGAGLLYIFIPYHLVGIYVRAALNDALLLAWFPWVLLAFDRLLTGDTNGWPRRLAVATLLLAGTLLTHTFALISFAPLLMTFVLFLLLYQLRFTETGRWRGLVGRILLALFAGGAALLLCTAFLLPLFVEGQYLDQQVYVTNTYDFHRHFVQFGQYFSPFWGFGYSDDPVGANDGMSFQVGLLALILAISGVFLRRRPAQLRWRAGYLGLLLLALLFLMSPWALGLWDAVPALAVIQFPWRLMALANLLICGLAGLVLYNLATSFNRLGVVVEEGQAVGLLLLGGLVIFASTQYVGAELQAVEPWREDGRAVYEFELEHPDMIAYTEWVREKPFAESPMSADYESPDYWEDHGYTTALTRFSVVQGVANVSSSESWGSYFRGVIQVERAATVRINLYYFPGWQVTVDGRPALYRVSEARGLMEVDLVPGDHRVEVRMGTTPVRQLGGIISGVTLFPILILLLWPGGRRKGEGRTG